MFTRPIGCFFRGSGGHLYGVLIMLNYHRNRWKFIENYTNVHICVVDQFLMN